jgi:hypothetical protein
MAVKILQTIGFPFIETLCDYVFMKTFHYLSKIDLVFSSGGLLLRKIEGLPGTETMLYPPTLNSELYVDLKL